MGYNDKVRSQVDDGHAAGAQLALDRVAVRQRIAKSIEQIAQRGSLRNRSVKSRGGLTCELGGPRPPAPAPPAPHTTSGPTPHPTPPGGPLPRRPTHGGLAGPSAFLVRLYPPRPLLPACVSVRLTP